MVAEVAAVLPTSRVFHRCWAAEVAVAAIADPAEQVEPLRLEAMAERQVTLG